MLPEQMLEQHWEPVVHAASLAEQVPVPASVVPVPASVVPVPPSAGGGGGGVLVDWQALVSSEVLRHSVPAQQVTPASPSQRVPTGEQIVMPPSGLGVPPPGTVHLRLPLLSGRHSEPLQHWSENWQALAVPVPGAMQQLGFAES